jgi:hypothetical protein
LLASTQNSPPKREKELSDMERLAKMDKAKADKEKADKDKPFKVNIFILLYLAKILTLA